MIVYSLFDRIIDLEFKYYEEEKASMVKNVVKRTERTFTIKCPETGIKPEITIEYKRVPEDFCYDVTITISNLWLQCSPIDIDEITATFGYASDNKQHMSRLLCHVFAAYTPTPGPDGYTVFKGIVASADGAFSSQTYTFHLYNNNTKTNKPWTINEVVTDTISQMKLNPHVWATTDILDETFSDKNIEEKVFASGYEMLNYLQATLNEIGKNHDPQVAFICLIFNDDVHFIGVAKGNRVAVTKGSDVADKAVSLIQKLDICTSAEWNAGVLTTVSPVVTELYPGRLFSLNPKYYQGSNALPNVVARSGLQKDKDDLYYVLTQQVKFSTTGSANEMIMTSVPYELSPLANGQANYSDLKPDVQKRHDTIAKALKTVVPIAFGEMSKEQQEHQEATQDIAKLNLSFPASAYATYTIKEGDTLSVLCSEKQFNLPDLKSATTNKVVKGYAAWTPVIAIITYSQHQKNKGSTKLWQLNPADPDNITTGHYLAIPNLTWKQVKQQYKDDVVKVMKAYYDYYKNKKEKPQWASSMKIAAEILEKEAVQ